MPISLSSSSPLLALLRRSWSKAETSYFWPSADSIKEGVGEAAGLVEDDSWVNSAGAVRARAAPALVVTILSPSESLESSSSADMRMVLAGVSGGSQCLHAEYISSEIYASKLADLFRYTVSYQPRGVRSNWPWPPQASAAFVNVATEQESKRTPIEERSKVG